MKGAVGAPPAGLERALAAVLRHRRFAPALLGDLAEEHAARAVASPARAALWYAGETLRLTLRFAAGAAAARARRALLPAPRRRSRSSRESAMGQFAFDLKLALRGLARRRGVAAAMALTLAAGLGVNAAIFGVADALVLHPYPFPDADRLIHLRQRAVNEEFYRTNVAPATFLELREAAGDVVEALVAYSGWEANLRGGEGPVPAIGYRVAPEFFAALDRQPALGRAFLPEETRFGAPPVVVLSHELWRLQFGADPAIVGRTVDVDGTSRTVVGVGPADLRFPEGAELWTPLAWSPEEAAVRDRRGLGVFARLRDGVTLEAARARLVAVGAEIAARNPLTEAGREVEVRTLAEGLGDPGLPPILRLWQAAAAFVLLIGCVNLANLVLARGAERQRELAVLDALGAGRSRLVRLQLAEGAVLGLGAALLALPIAGLALRLMRDAMPAGIRRYVAGWETLGLDLRVFGFTLLLALGAVLAVAVWPALRGARAGRDAGLLRDGGRGRTSGTGAQRGRSALVVAEVALGLTLVVAAALAVRGADAMLNGPLGFDPERLLTLRTILDEGRYPTPEARAEFARRAEERLAALPGVEGAAVANFLPGTGNNSSQPIVVEGEPEPDPAAPPLADYRAVSAAYFETVGLPLVAGRLPDSRDGAGSAPVAAISRSMAERFWPGRDPLGKRFRDGDSGTPWITVVGVVGDHDHHWFLRRGFPTYFRPLVQEPRLSLTFAVRTLGAPESLAREARAAVAAIDPLQAVFEVRSLRQGLYETTIGLHYVAAILSVFALLALVLSASGVYAVMAYRISLRTREIGVRVALGATAGDVLRATYGQALRLTGIGLAIGLVLSFAAARAIESALRGVTRLEPGLLAGAVAALAAAALVAAWFPSRRALAVQPADVLRGD